MHIFAVVFGKWPHKKREREREKQLAAKEEEEEERGCKNVMLRSSHLVFLSFRFVGAVSSAVLSRASLVLPLLPASLPSSPSSAPFPLWPPADGPRQTNPALSRQRRTTIRSQLFLTKSCRSCTLDDFILEFMHEHRASEYLFPAAIAVRSSNGPSCC